MGGLNAGENCHDSNGQDSSGAETPPAERPGQQLPDLEKSLIALGYISAILVGFALGLLGGGGSILTVPVLAYLFQIPASLATMYSLFVVGITSLVGTIGYLRLRLVDFRVGAFFLFPSLLGVWIARRVLLPAIPDSLMQGGSFVLTKDRLILLVFAGVMGLASYSMLRRPKQLPNDPRAMAKPGSKHIPIYGFMAGGLMGFVGAGGGFLIIPVLVGLGKMEMKPAVGTSLLIITLSSLFGFAGDFLNASSVNWSFLLTFSSLSIAGVFLGAQLSKKVSAQALKRGFGFMILGVSLLMVLKETFYQ